jgi:hypothetical protein
MRNDTARSSLFALLTALALVLAPGCARLGGEGEHCTAPGLDPSAFGGCAEGLVCTPEPGSITSFPQRDNDFCRRACTSNTDCPTGQSCRTVANAEYQMACQPN